MPQTVLARLESLGVSLPKLTPPVANYVPFVFSGPTLYISGQLPLGAEGAAFRGHLGADLGVEEGYAAAKLCALNIVAQVHAALDGDLDRVARCLRLGGFVSCTPEFTDHPKVINGASDFIVSVFGAAGKHARAAVGVASLPLGVAVEVDAVFEVRA